MTNVQNILIVSNAATLLAIWFASIKIALAFAKMKTETERNTKDIKTLFNMVSKGG